MATRPDRAVGQAREDGSAVVDFVLVGLLLTLLFLAVLQFGLALHVRNTLTAAAAEGARYGANADRGPEQAAERSRALIREALSDSFASDVTGGTETVDGVPTVYVEIDATLPLVGWLGAARALTVRGHAVDEGP